MATKSGKGLGVCFVLLFFALAVAAGAAGQEGSLQQVKGLNQQVIQLYQQGRFTDAIALAQRALAIGENALGPDHPATAGALTNLVELYRATGAYAKAEPLAQRALAIIEKARGLDHPDTAVALTSLAKLYQATGAYAQAEPLYERALGILGKVFGPDHPATVAALNNLVTLYGAMHK